MYLKYRGSLLSREEKQLPKLLNKVLNNSTVYLYVHWLLPHILVRFWFIKHPTLISSLGKIYLLQRTALL